MAAAVNVNPMEAKVGDLFQFTPKKDGISAGNVSVTKTMDKTKYLWPRLLMSILKLALNYFVSNYNFVEH